ncbi:hypothetical protein M0802_006525 [Mischocyttarus mexicanus]|nr:hypothetical protein M0802_006525 [Mischocyttarus mexicanus]
MAMPVRDVCREILNSQCMTPCKIVYGECFWMHSATDRWTRYILENVVDRDRWVNAENKNLVALPKQQCGLEDSPMLKRKADAEVER